MTTYIEIETPIRKRHCHECRRQIIGKHLRVSIISAGVGKHVNICRDCVRYFAEQLVDPDQIFKP